MRIDEDELIIISDVLSHFRQKLEQVEQGQPAIWCGNLISGKFWCLQLKLLGEFVEDMPTCTIILSVAVTVGD